MQDSAVATIHRRARQASSTRTLSARVSASITTALPTGAAATVLATDEASVQGNPLCGQPQSNLWFGRYDDLRTWGEASASGAVWVKDRIAAGTTSAVAIAAVPRPRRNRVKPRRLRPEGSRKPR